MLNDKRIFWISIVIFILALLFTVLSAIFDGKSWEIVNGVSMGIVGGAFISAISAIIAFLSEKKAKEIKFASLTIICYNHLKKIFNWYEHDKNKIKTKVNQQVNGESSMNVLLYQKVIIDKQNIVITARLIQYLEDFSSRFEDDELYFILDDYCGLIYNKRNKVKNAMIEIRKELSKYDYTYYSNINEEITKYHNDMTNSQQLIKNLILAYEKMCFIPNEPNKIVNKYNAFIKLAKLTEYTRNRQ